MSLRLLPLITGLLPILVIHASLLIAINAGSVPACLPYFEGCTSISATGRYEPASFLFKPAMIAEAVLMIAYWLTSVAWLRAMYLAAGQPTTVGRSIGVIGTIGALFLMVYITYLGTHEPIYEFMRRFGVYVYFAGTVTAQLILVAKLFPVCGSSDVLRRIARAQLALALVPFVLGILNLVLKAVLDDADAIENSIEWIFALLVHCYFVLSYFAWRDTGFAARFTLSL